MFTVTLFIPVRKWKWPEYLSNDAWICRKWYLYTMKYLFNNREEGSINTCFCMDETWKHAKWKRPVTHVVYCMFYLYEMFREVKFIEPNNKLVIAESWGLEWGMGSSWVWGCALEWWKSSKIRFGQWLHNYVTTLKNLWIVYFKWILWYINNSSINLSLKM